MSGLSQAHIAKLARSSALMLSGNRFTGQLVRTLCFGLGLRDVAIAPDSGNAEDRLHLSKVDLVIADSGPATYDPLPVLAMLRKLPDRRQAECPIILLSSGACDEACGAALSPLIEINKPISSQPLIDAILRLVFKLQPSPAAEQASGHPTGRLTTLLVTGNPYTAQIIRALLAPLGLADIAVLRAPADAERALKETRHDLVIIDSGPASFDGLAAFERATRASAAHRVPVLLLAPDPSEALVARARAAKIKSIVTKPIDPSLLAGRVSRLLKLRAA